MRTMPVVTVGRSDARMRHGHPDESGFFFHRVAAAFFARADRCSAVIDFAALFPPLLPSLARCFRSAAGTCFAIAPSLADKHPTGNSSLTCLAAKHNIESMNDEHNEPICAEIATDNAPSRELSGSAKLIDRDIGQWQRLKSLVLDAVTSAHSRRSYELALDGFFSWWEREGRPPFTKAAVQAFRAKLEGDGLAPATINVRLSAIRKLAVEAADNGLLDPDLAAGIGRVKGAKRLGVRLGNWLTLGEAQALLGAPDATTVKGKRDRAILAVLLGCALRRSEVASLEVEQLQQRDGRWVVADLIGKGGRVRTVPVPAWVKVAIDEWLAVAGIVDGRVWRSINRGGRVWGGGLTEKVIWHVVEQYAAEAGLPNIAPHDLRRTSAKLCRAGGGELEQIQLLLGHASVQTTERYLGTRQNLADAPNDHTGLRLASD